MTEMNVATNDQVEAKINDKESIILDVREPAEYAMQHIPNSTLIPLGELENRLDEIDKDKTVYVICRSEERRVGKECRSMWIPDRDIKKKVQGVQYIRN